MKKLLILGSLALQHAMLYAASTEGEDMPWNTTLQKIVKSLEGPTAKIIGIASILVLGAGFLVSDGGLQKSKIFWVAVGLSVMFNAGMIVSTIFAGGALL